MTDIGISIHFIDTPTTLLYDVAKLIQTNMYASLPILKLPTRVFGIFITVNY